MAWSSVKNKYLSESTAQNRGIQFTILLKEVLKDTASWKCIAYGDGTSAVDVDISTGVTPNFPAFPSVSGMGANIWFAVESNSGAQIVFQNDSSGYTRMYWSPSGSYTDDSPTATTRLGGTTPPSDEISMQNTYVEWGGSGNHYLSVAYTTDGESFIVFGQRNANDERGALFLKLANTKAGDLYPYVAYWQARESNDVWQLSDLYTPASNFVIGRHPTNNTKEYCFGNVMWDSVDLMATMPADPLTGDEQLVELLVACQVAANYHIRGKADGIVRMSGLRSTGDSFDSNTYMGIGDFAIAGWNSTTPLLS